MRVLYGFVNWENIFTLCFKEKSQGENESTMMRNAATVASSISYWGCIRCSWESPLSFTDNTVMGRYWKRVVTHTALILCESLVDDPGKSQQVPEGLQGWGLCSSGSWRTWMGVLVAALPPGHGKLSLSLGHLQGRVYISSCVICKFRYAGYKNSFFFFPRHHPAGSIRIKALLMVWVLETGPGIPALWVRRWHWQQRQDALYHCWWGQSPLLLAPVAPALTCHGPCRAQRVLMASGVPAESHQVPSRQLGSYLRLAPRSMRRGFGRLGFIHPHPLAALAGSAVPNTAPALLIVSLLWAWAGFPPSLNQQVILLITDKGLSWLR